MGRIKINEEQYKRLFLSEQSNLDAERSNSYTMRMPDGKNYKGITADWIEKNFNKWITSQEQGDFFRKWVNEVDSDYAKSIDLDETGSYNNAFIKEAWKKYGFEFLLNNEISNYNPFTQEKIDPPVYKGKVRKYRPISTQKEITNRKANDRLLLDRNKSSEDFSNFIKNYIYTGEERGSGSGNKGKTGEEILKYQNEQNKNLGLPEVSWMSLYKGKFLPHNGSKIINEGAWNVFRQVEEYKSFYGSLSCRYIYSKDISNMWKGSQGGATGAPITINTFGIDPLKKLSDNWSRTPPKLKGTANWLSYWLLADFYFDKGKFEDKEKENINWFEFLNTLYGTADVKVIKQDISNAWKYKDDFHRFRKCTTHSDLGVVKALEKGAKWVYQNVTVHDVLQVAAAIFFLIPGGQPIAIFLEVLDSGIYYAEGDAVSGTMGLAFAFIPGFGPIFRRVTGTGLKKVKNVITKADDVVKQGGGDDAVKEVIKKESKKLSPAENEMLELILKHSDDIAADMKRMANMDRRSLKAELIERNAKLEEWLHGTGSESKYQADLDKDKLSYSSGMAMNTMVGDREVDGEQGSETDPLDNISTEKVIMKPRTDDNQKDEVKDGVRIIYLDTDSSNVNLYNNVLNKTTAPSADDNKKALDYLNSL